MRLALISDIHGHLLALDAALADSLAQGVERVVCLGDVALSGPRPSACVARLRALAIPTAQGNCDDLALRLRREGRTPERMASYARWGRWVGEIDAWSAEALSEADAAWLAALPMTLTVALAPDATLLCAHGSPASFNHRLLPDTPDAALREMVGPLASGVAALASGHTHLPMTRRLDALTLINPGSVGLPMASDPATGAIYNPPEYAEYAIVAWEEGGLRVEPRRVALGPAAVRADAEASGMPFAARWRGDWSQP